MYKKTVCLFLSISFVFQQMVFANPAVFQPVSAGFERFHPPLLRSVSFDPRTDDFRVILDKGDIKEDVRADLDKVFRYFRVGLSMPDDSFWVNLKPDASARMIDPDLERTELGRVLLEADVQLKKDLAALTAPNTEKGRQYWDKLYQKAESLMGTETVKIPTLSRPWIVPAEVIMVEDTTGSGAYIYKATLKVMLEQDYLKDSQAYNFQDQRLKELNEYSAALIRETIIPSLNTIINTSKKYAALRQAYHSLILAQWFKKHSVKGSYASTVDSRDLSGLTSQSWSKEEYYKEYTRSFRDGEYNLTENKFSRVRNYSSGGVVIEDVVPTAYARTLQDGGAQDVLLKGDLNVYEGIKGYASFVINGATTSPVAAKDGGMSPESVEMFRVAGEGDEWEYRINTQLGNNDLYRQHFSATSTLRGMAYSVFDKPEFKALLLSLPGVSPANVPLTLFESNGEYWTNLTDTHGVTLRLWFVNEDGELWVRVTGSKFYHAPMDDSRGPAQDGGKVPFPIARMILTDHFQGLFDASSYQIGIFKKGTRVIITRAGYASEPAILDADLYNGPDRTRSNLMWKKDETARTVNVGKSIQAIRSMGFSSVLVKTDNDLFKVSLDTAKDGGTREMKTMRGYMTRIELSPKEQEAADRANDAARKKDRKENGNRSVYIPQKKDGGNNVGGIDLRSIPIASQPIGVFIQSLFQGMTPSAADLDVEMRSLNGLFNINLMPSAQRLKEFVVGCYQKGEMKERSRGILALLAQMLRLDDGQTDTDIRSLLVLLNTTS
ncbi:MAG: hypothetical protein ACM3OC_04785 [Deltaproteobacteria bacterium]